MPGGINICMAPKEHIFKNIENVFPSSTYRHEGNTVIFLVGLTFSFKQSPTDVSGINLLPN